MGRQHSKRRSMVIRIKRKRRIKLGLLRGKYQKADFDSDREKIWEKVLKIAPWLTKEEFLKPINEKKTA